MKKLRPFDSKIKSDVNGDGSTNDGGNEKIRKYNSKEKTMLYL